MLKCCFVTLQSTDAHLINFVCMPAGPEDDYRESGRYLSPSRLLADQCHALCVSLQPSCELHYPRECLQPLQKNDGTIGSGPAATLPFAC